MVIVIFLSPYKLFQSVIAGALPTFKFAGSYTVERDLQYQSHLRVTLQCAKDAKNLLVDWDLGERLAGMREVDADGYLVGGKQVVVAPTRSLLAVAADATAVAVEGIASCVMFLVRILRTACRFVHAFCKGTAVQQLTATGGFRGVYTWEGGTPSAQQLT
ncbi:hypothetical protein B0H16DRAFT_1482166 [Mycena metata]|uniref:Uncharacterized protein n=1 Tax=Mycena metata TaxID=1033252 RepID=A0AAD7GUT3_9AGAR|nr:hypothetical protein B0H16DRAFT_1482166 [Mycena metata]